MENQIPTKEEIMQHILTQRENIASLGVVRIGLFGSFARGEQTSSSDIDTRRI
jgi:predicted nucleotidyltransferase